MIPRLFSTQSKTITGAAVILGLAGFLSRIIGLLRDRLLAHLFGAGPTLDAYYAAFRIPDTIYTLLIVGALSAGFIPVVGGLLKEKNARAKEVTNAILSLTLVGLGALSFVAFLAAPFFIEKLTPGFNAETRALTLTLTKIMLLSPILLGVSGILGSILQMHKLFRVYALTPIVYNVGIMLGACLFVPIFGPIGLGYGVILGALLHVAIQLPSVFRLGYVFRPNLTTKLTEVRTILRLMIPRLLGLGAAQANLLYITSLASTLGAGALSVFSFANNVQYVPIGMIALSFAVAAFPTLSELAAKDDIPALRTQISQTVGQLLFFLLPCTALLILLRAQIVRVILGSGAFDWSATIDTADAVAFFAVSLFAQGLIPLLARAHFARENTTMPLLAAVFGTITTIALGPLTIKTLGAPGLALAFSAGAVIQFAVLWTTLRLALGTLHEKMRLPSLLKMTVATIVMGLIVQYVKGPLAALVDMTRFWGIFTQGFVAGCIGLIVYTGLTFLLKTEEMLRFFESLNKRFVNIREVPSAPPQNDTLT